MTFIRPVELNGMVQRTNDISTMKQNEDAKPVHDQNNFQNTVHRHTEHITHEVANKDNADRGQNHFDAKEKGRNEYFRQQDKRQKKEHAGDKMIVREENKGFDIKI